MSYWSPCLSQACHRDPKLWDKPDQFHPEHFLEGGALVENKPGFLPYGVGARVCPGAALADMQIFLVLANILNQFNLVLPDGDKGEVGTQFKVIENGECFGVNILLSQSGTAILRNPKPYRIVISSRD